MKQPHPSPTRRNFLAAAAATSVGVTGFVSSANAGETKKQPIVRPPAGKRILLSCKLGMIAEKVDGKALSLVERLNLAKEAGFDGVDFDRAGNFTPEQARDAVAESGVFVHNAINHAHWQKRLTSANQDERAAGRANIEHCIRVSHAAGGNGVLIVVGRGTDGTPDAVNQRARDEIQKLIPLAAALGQPILIENVWNRMHYNHDGKPEQSAKQYVEFVDSFKSPWVGMYYDIGNHWKYGQPGDWLRELGHRCVKLDVKGFSRKKDSFTDIGEGDLPWEQVRKGLKDINFTGWATAETRGGGLERLTTIHQQMVKAFAL